MLPPLSDKLGSKLQLLVPVAIAPSLVSTRRSALLELKKVDAVQVSSVGKKDQFVVEVFADSSAVANADNEEPARPDEARPRRPTTQIARTQMDFVHLRNQVYELAHAAHRRDPCEFCAGILDLIVFGANPDGFWVGLLGGKRMAKTLAGFANVLLKVTTQHTCTDTRGCCDAQTSVPQLVHTFLFKAASEVV
ncbi:hypothetical protein PHYSODRAFT_486573 [Phytophthora sojae]|uniref:Uncharacterized protein n=1 Tax=Phytophthora sojae (strain P6497) TaxID=1094619 RepID=G4YWV0_PHYSP|nr:hypothetical protein PHYSODRAFT_486573 [Phytophthora sojae]EGZ24448.1 hypothetical protein PHYSODRAFT_486573 [Phytophthora sojae]|eukprot:XP_009519736.1 hypothetical protein PHYSODRAFT_486573 [Phytophthora sojae]